ncbi:MAG: orotidine 5'-phosphate decarboxylase [Heterodermia speciosa]|uniref:Orotidine 5'-phosphate decarboxylase n=1 Tax=Heterodermia speciosa TaxID=116794 RepID=A0A8H3FT55_9LECA|nr:MAG: orotidine 5'-phosphate decarboxylase [Heterodermia speciosa]
MSSSTISLPYSLRADNPNAPTLTSYLLQLISIKQSNLCVSADVHTSSALLRLAEEIGDHICVLKTHADIIDDFSDQTIKRLNEVSRRKHFLLFEDRKFGDIGSTVQSQYTRGPLAIATWAHLTNAHIFPGPAIIKALHSAARDTLLSINQSVSTEISIGTPRESLDGSANGEEIEDVPALISEDSLSPRPSDAGLRKGSIVTATTTISQTFEPGPPSPGLYRTLSTGEGNFENVEMALQELGPPPHARGLLLLAEMSSEGNLMTKEYTSNCLKLARKDRDFVVGFVSQRSLNTETEDTFLAFTPGLSLPPEGSKDDYNTGDGLGQQWRSPKEVVGKDGADIIIVGRGILNAKDRRSESERYRKAAWAAYEERIGRRPL